MKRFQKCGVTLSVNFDISEAFTITLFVFFWFTFEAVLFILLLTICLPTTRTLLSGKSGLDFVIDFFFDFCNS